jgi:hypothetical protein
VLSLAIDGALFAAGFEARPLVICGILNFPRSPLVRGGPTGGLTGTEQVPL